MIKFRGFSEEKQEWIYGSHSYAYDNENIFEHQWISGQDTIWRKVVPESVGQFVKTEDGTDIYEGDISFGEWWLDGLNGESRHVKKYAVMQWNETDLCFEWSRDFPSLVRREIVGNVFQNPELLEK